MCSFFRYVLLVGGPFHHVGAFLLLSSPCEGLFWACHPPPPPPPPPYENLCGAHGYIRSDVDKLKFFECANNLIVCHCQHTQKVFTMVQILCEKLFEVVRIHVGLVAILNLDILTVLTISWSSVRTAMIFYCSACLYDYKSNIIWSNIVVNLRNLSIIFIHYSIKIYPIYSVYFYVLNITDYNNYGRSRKSF